MVRQIEGIVPDEDDEEDTHGYGLGEDMDQGATAANSDGNTNNNTNNNRYVLRWGVHASALITISLIEQEVDIVNYVRVFLFRSNTQYHYQH